MEELIKNMNNKEIEYENKNYSEKRENYIKILNVLRHKGEKTISPLELSCRKKTGSKHLRIRRYKPVSI